MKGAYTISVAASDAPISLLEAKAHLKVDFSDEDSLIGIYIKAATEYVEQHTRRALMTQTITHTRDFFPRCTFKNPWGSLALYRSPVISFTSLEYVDVDGNSAILVLDTDFVLNKIAEPSIITPKDGQNWPETAKQTGAITMTYISGYSDAANVPSAIKSAILLLIGELYERRENFVKTMPDAVGYLLAPYVIREF